MAERVGVPGKLEKLTPLDPKLDPESAAHGEVLLDELRHRRPHDRLLGQARATTARRGRSTFA
jgi:hypothetical protein